MKKLKASMTAYVALSLLLVMSLLFALVEAARVKGLGAYADMTAGRSRDSLFSMYNRLLWDEYGMLYFDGGVGSSSMRLGEVESLLRRYAEDDSEKGDFYRLIPEQSALPEYCLATDNGGRAFIRQACAKIWRILGRDSLDGLYSSAETAEEKLGGFDGKAVGDGAAAVGQINNKKARMRAAARSAREKQEAAERAAKEAEEKGEDVDLSGYELTAEEEEALAMDPRLYAEDTAEESYFKSLIEQVNDLRSDGVLSLVIKDTSSLSSGEINLQDTLLVRNCNQGRGNPASSPPVYEMALEKVIFPAYLASFYSSYAEKKDNRGMSYELEYVLSGRATDKENLRVALDKLLFVREAENLASLYSDGAKIAQLEALSLTISAILPELAPVIAFALAGAWAFTESVLDIRTLLEGGKIAAVKNPVEWTSTLYELPAFFAFNQKAKEQPGGFSYNGFLAQLIFIVPDSIKAYRAMDMMEASLRKTKESPNARMDNMIAAASYQIDFETKPLFASFVSTADYNGLVYSFQRSGNFSYY